MKKTALLALLLLTLMLGGCSAGLPLSGSLTTAVPGVDAPLPEAQAPAEQVSLEAATLYFRYMEEPFLAQETRLIAFSPSRPYELSLLTELLSGPGSHSSDLTSLFPAGTRVLSTVTQGRTLFVTLSQELLSGYADDRTATLEEQQLRRRLCMQSIVATITENCDIDRVQILMEQDGGATGSLRLQESYYLVDAQATAPAEPLIRQDELLLSPQRTAQLISQLWCQRDWQRLYQYIARRDPSTGAERVSYRDFVTAMENLPVLSSCSVTGGTITQDGSCATFTISGAVLESGRETLRTGCSLRLCRENSLWRVTLAQLTGWLEE